MPLAWIPAVDSLATLKHTISIAGGGLAGLSLGIALQSRGVSVTLHEASTYPRHRVCGEFISGVRDESLDVLGLADCLNDATHLRSVCWSDAAGKLAEMEAPGRGISRWKLDDLLQQRFVALGGTLLTNSRIAPTQGVIWAAGRPRQPSNWLGLKCHARGLTLSHDLEMFTFPFGYFGLAKIEEGKVNICGLFKNRRTDGAKGTRLLLAVLRDASLNALADRLEGADLDASSFCGAAGFQTGLQEGPSFRIGDAAGMIPPFTGNGMSMAFESAECALQPALDYTSGHASWAEAGAATATRQSARFRRRMTTAALLHRFLLHPTGLKLAGMLARSGCLPLQAILHLVR